MNLSVDNYFIEGCGRCPLAATAACKVRHWADELALLRSIIQTCGLTEECKWGVPCYTYNGKNVLTISALNNYCAVSFFKGSLLKDDLNLLVKPGPHSQVARLFKFTKPEEIVQNQDHIKAYIFEAIANEKAGLKVEFQSSIDAMPSELEDKLNQDLYFKSAFESLTPGRQRGYIIYFSQPKKSETRKTRIEKSIEKILNGEGLHDKYSSRKRENQE